MRALAEHKQLIQDIDCLLRKMAAEIELLRNINYRYYLMHGNKIQNGLLNVPENISFDVFIETNGDVQCRVIDYAKLNLESDYQKIKSELRRLS